MWLLVDALATYRLTRLVVKDTVTERFRRWFAHRYEGPLVYLSTCPWCMSIWIAAAVVALTWGVPLAWSYVAAGLAFSTVAGYLSDREF
jgi:hypothetical protein